MIISLAILFIFTLLGCLFKFSNSKIDELILSSIKGYLLLIGLSYIISYNFLINGADAVLISLAILFSALIIKVMIYTLKNRRIIFNKKIINLYLRVTTLPLLTILLPVLIIGIEKFYGVYNFDFFYNSQDSWYLSTHNVIEFFKTTNDYIIPLDWSANEQGRFAVTLLGAFAVKYLSFNALEFNSYLLQSLIIMSGQVFFVFARRIFNMTYFYSLISTIFFICSGPFVQGYIYYLLGQISAIPLFIYVLILYRNLITNQNNKNLFWFIFVLNVLYILYAILSIYAILLVVTTTFSLYFYKKYNINFSTIIIYFLSFLFLFLILRISNLEILYESIKQWILLSLQTAGAEKGIIVFSEYLTEMALMLQWGLIPYSSFNSLLSFIHQLPYGSVVYFSIGLISLFCYLIILFNAKKTLNILSYLIVFNLSAIVIFSSFLFFMIQSPYPLFKTSVWFIPILLPLFLYGILHFYSKKTIFIISSVVLLLNILTSSTYLIPFVKNNENPFLSTYPVDKNEILDLRKYLIEHNINSLALNLTDGIHAAWLSNFLRNFEIYNITHNLQPLADKDLLINKRYELSNKYLITMNHDYDIFKKNIYSDYKPLMETLTYSLYKASDIKIMLFIGSGSYQPTKLSQKIASNSGLPKTFRWVEKGFELLVYSDEPRTVDLSFDVRQGYVDSNVEERSIRLDFNNKKDNFVFKTKTKIEKKNILLDKGMNKIIIESKDPVTPLDRVSGLFRKNITVDSRLLNFMISDISVTMKD